MVKKHKLPTVGRASLKSVFLERDPQPDHPDELVHGDVHARRHVRRLRRLHLRHEPQLRHRGEPVRLLPGHPLHHHLFRPHHSLLHLQIRHHFKLAEGSGLPTTERHL